MGKTESEKAQNQYTNTLHKYGSANKENHRKPQPLYWKPLCGNQCVWKFSFLIPWCIVVQAVLNSSDILKMFVVFLSHTNCMFPLVDSE